MRSDNPEIVFVFPAVMGGVSSFNFNLINNSNLIKKFSSKVILLREETDQRPLFTETFNVDEQVVFRYSDNENQYHLQKRLHDLLGNEEGAIVTDNGLTMEASARFNNPKTVFSLIHDYYYVNQNMRLGALADIAIAHSSFFSDAVFAADPGSFAERSLYIPYGVTQVPELPLKNNAILKVVFLGRLENEKGVTLLGETDDILLNNNTRVEWTIIGKGSLREELRNQWKGKANVQFCEPGTTSEVYDLLQKQDLFLFPTGFEGTPVSILECIANGVVPVVNDLPGGIRDIVQESIGYRCSINNINQYATIITSLDQDRNHLKDLQANCLVLAREKYDVKKNADLYFELFLKYKKFKRPGNKAVRKLVKLDRPLFSNNLVKAIRSFK